jgi:hypothetical protein
MKKLTLTLGKRYDMGEAVCFSIKGEEDKDLYFNFPDNEGFKTIELNEKQVVDLINYLTNSLFY